MKSKWRGFLIVIFGIALGIVICELAVRVLWNLQIIKMDNLGVISYEFMRELSDPDLPYEIRPHVDITTGMYHIVTNRDGFRDRDYAIKKDDDVMRILVIGDSITFGYSLSLISPFLGPNGSSVAKRRWSGPNTS